eukprot:CAMPEP_0115857544 /NCGR_PEP_ID=MMETSP0287-20121206/15629_1 /TAXON_ID=412157 /ORGANISM="Chrysochromulina rotalis, Strain UIO044" /LENGTH=320 /DNA_ID=CAMNT_0003311765 /DNA_START=1 /DNA_END=963 /DNA_ORIENTATION=-
MGIEVEVNVTTVSVCAVAILVTVLCEFFIAKPLFTTRLRTHEHRSTLAKMVLLFAGVGLVPVIFSAGFFAIIMVPEAESIIDPTLHAIEAIALLLFWHILIALAGGRARAAMCVDMSPAGAACILIPFGSNCAICRFRDGEAALRFWHYSVVQWIVLSPAVRVMAQNSSNLVRKAAIPIQVIGLIFMLRGLLDTHRGTRHAAPRHARPDAQFIAIKMLVLVLLVQTIVYAQGWPPPGSPPEDVTRAFAFLTVLEMVGFALLFAGTFGPHTLWWALDKTQLTAALTEHIADSGGMVRGVSARAGTYAPVDDASIRRCASAV